VHARRRRPAGKSGGCWKGAYEHRESIVERGRWAADATGISRFGHHDRDGACAADAIKQAAGCRYITLGVEGFSADDVMKVLVAHGLTRSATPSTAPMTAWIVRRGDTPELFLNDPGGLKIQLQDVSYCGGSGRLGDRCSRPVT
jgi:hypothetical protein